MRMIDADALYEELNNIGGCDAEKNTYFAGWDDAISEAITLLQDQPTVALDSDNETRNKMQQIISHYGINHQVDKAIEEMAELTKALLKRRHEHINVIEMFEHITEEIADVLTTIQELMLIYGCEEKVLQVQTEKLNRQIERMKAGA